MDQIVERPDTAKFASPEPIEEALALKGAGRRRRRWPLLVVLVLAAGGGVEGRTVGKSGRKFYANHQLCRS